MWVGILATRAILTVLTAQMHNLGQTTDQNIKWRLFRTRGGITCITLNNQPTQVTLVQT